jgi:2-polyprenyl-3-methyl-5-hydroxy-6-metoxy-1,4-benzoquinol methylase
MSASLLVIMRGEEAARAAFEAGEPVEWARALPLLLEKHGYLEFEVAPPSALCDRRRWSRHAAILVPRLSRSEWTEEAITAMFEGSAQALLEMPPQDVLARIGVEAVEPASREGVFMPVDVELKEDVARRSVLGSTRLEGPQSRPVDRDSEQDWRHLAVPIDPELARRWGEPAWSAERWSSSGEAETLAEWVELGGEERRWPGLVRQGSVTASCFSLFGYLGQQLTMAPIEGPEHLIWQRSIALEAALFSLIDEMHGRAGAARTRVMPWPEGAEWVLNVRHDFDRSQTRRQVEKVLEAHADAGSAATWYWRARHAGPVAARVAAAPKNEVALHTEMLWDSAAEERATVEQAIRRPVHGSSAHGDPTCFRWQGAPNVLWAERQGLDYTEFISHAHLVPHRFAALDGNGLVEPLSLVCLPHHESLDRSTKPGDAATDGVLAAAETYVRAGGLMQILNHPDLNLLELRDVLDRLPKTGRLDWTAEQVADWWKRTHVVSELEISTAADGQVSVGSRRGVRGLVVEILAPDGDRRLHSVQLDAGDRVTFGSSTGSVPTLASGRTSPRWAEDVAPAFAAATREYYADRGMDPEEASSRSTIATNTSLVPGRVDGARRYLRDLGGLDSMAGLRVLDCGAGFGAFAAYLALGDDAPLVTAIDNRPEFTEIGSNVAAEVGLDGVVYETSEMQDLGRYDRESFDVVVVNNALIYLTGAEQRTAALREFHRVLAPAGRALVFHANRWQLREPFTGAPLVHLMPRGVADLFSRTLGWEHNHGRVDLVSAPRLRRELRSAGFGEVQIGGLAKGRVVSPPRAHFGRFYAAVAGKQAASPP